MKIMTTFALALLSAILSTACTRDIQAMDAQQIEQQYGVSGAYAGTVATSDGPVKGTLVPITLANGRQDISSSRKSGPTTLMPSIFATIKGCIPYNSKTT